jgi:Esterase/lipase
MSKTTSAAEHELPPLDPECAAILNKIPEEYSLNSMLNFDDLPASRERIRDAMEMMTDTEETLKTVHTKEISIPGPTDAEQLQLRVHSPADTTGPFPCVYWIHGGGMVIGSAEEEDATAHRLADELNCVVVAPEYRLAPEHPYPSPVDDCYAGVNWVSENATELNIDDSRVAIAGPSAGGGLAAGVALRARDEGEPELCFQLLIYPMLDDRNETVSSKQVTDIGIWDREMNIEAWDAYLGDRSGSDEIPSYAAPARSSDLSGLPPTFLDVGTHDAFRDETTAYARQLTASGVETECHLWSGGFHAYDKFAPEAELSQKTWKTRFDALRQALTE